MKDRILNNFKSTILGLIILAICAVLIYTDKATFAEVSGFLVSSGLLIYVKDSIFKI